VGIEPTEKSTFVAVSIDVISADLTTSIATHTHTQIKLKTLKSREQLFKKQKKNKTTLQRESSFGLDFQII
jgi:hypothetical protein